MSVNQKYACPGFLEAVSDTVSPHARTLSFDLTKTRIALILVHESQMYKTSKTSMSAARLPAGKVRQDFAETVNRVAYGGERIVLHRRGRNLAALIPLEDLALLEELEDRQDAEEARKALADAKAKGEKPIPWAQAKKKLDL